MERLEYGHRYPHHHEYKYSYPDPYSLPPERDEPRDTRLPTCSASDVKFTILISLCGCMGMGIMIGWGVSLFAACGRFDVQGYVNQYLKDRGCEDEEHCDDDIVRAAYRRANDLAIQYCFKYCGTGAVVGILVGVALLGCIGIQYYGERIRESVCMVNCRHCVVDTKECWETLRVSCAACQRRSNPWFKRALRSCKVGCEGVGKNCGVCITECIKKWRQRREHHNAAYNVRTHHQTHQSSQNKPLLVPLLSHEYSSCPSPRPPPILYADPHSPHYYEQQETTIPYQPPPSRIFTGLVQEPQTPPGSQNTSIRPSFVPPAPPTFSSPAAPLWDSFSHFSQIPPFNLDASDQV